MKKKHKLEGKKMNTNRYKLNCSRKRNVVQHTKLFSPFYFYSSILVYHFLFLFFSFIAFFLSLFRLHFFLNFFSISQSHFVFHIFSVSYKKNQNIWKKIDLILIHKAAFYICSSAINVRHEHLKNFR